MTKQAKKQTLADKKAGKAKAVQASQRNESKGFGPSL
jgi:hypothetical protein